MYIHICIYIYVYVYIYTYVYIYILLVIVTKYSRIWKAHREVVFLVFLHYFSFCFPCVFLFCVFLLLLFFSTNCSSFFPFWIPICFPFILFPVFFRFEVLFFDFPCVFLLFYFFSSLKIIRINYRGEHNYSQFSGVKSPLSDTPEYHIVACTPNYPIWSHYIPMLLPYCWLNHRICMYIHIYIYTIRQSNIAMEKIWPI